MYKQITYKLNKVDFMLFELANFEAKPNKKANTGQAIANVYIKGPQYETLTPVKIKNNTSTILSTMKYIESKVNIYVTNVFLSVFRNFKNLSMYFKIFTTFM